MHGQVTLGTAASRKPGYGTSQNKLHQLPVSTEGAVVSGIALPRGGRSCSNGEWVAVIDHWGNDAVVGTYVTAPEAFAAIRQLGQKTQRAQWRYTLRPVKRETANS